MQYFLDQITDSCLTTENKFDIEPGCSAFQSAGVPLSEEVPMTGHRLFCRRR